VRDLFRSQGTSSMKRGIGRERGGGREKGVFLHF